MRPKRESRVRKTFKASGLRATATAATKNRAKCSPLEGTRPHSPAEAARLRGFLGAPGAPAKQVGHPVFPSVTLHLPTKEADARYCQGRFFFA